MAKAAAGENTKSEKQTLFSQVKSFFVGEEPKEAPKATPEEITPPTTPDPTAASASVKE